VSKQKEVGVKYDGGQLAATLALFHTSKPSGQLNDQQIFGEYSEDRHQGVELTLFGEPVQGLRVLGGATYLEAEQQDTPNGANDGMRVIGAAKWQGNLGLEW